MAWLCKHDGALSSISMSPTQIGTFIHSSHTITPKRLEASPSINRGKLGFFLVCLFFSSLAVTKENTNRGEEATICLPRFFFYCSFFYPKILFIFYFSGHKGVVFCCVFPPVDSGSSFMDSILHHPPRVQPAF